MLKRAILLLTVLMAAFAPTKAAHFACTDADGNVTLTDRALTNQDCRKVGDGHPAFQPRPVDSPLAATYQGNPACPNSKEESEAMITDYVNDGPRFKHSGYIVNQWIEAYRSFCSQPIEPELFGYAREMYHKHFPDYQSIKYYVDKKRRESRSR